MKKSVYIYTYGCQMNMHDSEKIRGGLAQNGYTMAEAPGSADLIIFNTCAIREKAEQKFYSQLGRIKHYKKKNPGMKIAVAGCIAQDSKKRIFSRAPYVDYVLGPQNIHLVNSLASEENKVLYADENPDIAHQEYKTDRQSRSRAWISIMYGCNNFCSYCIVPFTRGREVSRPSSSILSEIKVLAESGYKEITLLGQNVNSYRSDIGFVELLRKIDSLGIGRVRFVTSHPRDLSLELIDAMAELETVCEHLHLPLQAGSDRVLHAMNRRYTYSDYAQKIGIIRERIPGISITTDIIAGFPGETEVDYQESVRALQELEFDGMFAFKYSRRVGTKACELKDHVEEQVKSDRLNHLLKIQEDITLKKNRMLEGTVQEILLEGVSDTDKSMLMGRTRSNKIVTIQNCGESEGDFVQAKIVKARHHSLSGINLKFSDV